MGTENRHGSRRDLIDLVDEQGAFRPQSLDDVPIVDDFVADVDRRAVLFERPLDNLDSPFDPGTKASRLC
jgi:hypothetical protein